MQKSIKEEIIKEIDLLSPEQQQTVLGVLENYIHSQEDETEWNQIPEPWKRRIEESLKQADNGQLLPHKKVMQDLKRNQSN
jgi:predicted transcriptional regulator